MNFVTLSLSFALAASAASAQTAETSAGTSPGTLGSDWSANLGSALFSPETGTVRSANDIRAKWPSLSETDKSKIRRDCMVHMQRAGGGLSLTAPDTTGAQGGVIPGDGAATPMPPTVVTAAQMDEICAASKDL